MCLCGGEVSRVGQTAIELADALAAVDRLVYDAWLKDKGIHVEWESGGEVGRMPRWKYLPWRLLWRLGIKLGTRPREL